MAGHPAVGVQLIEQLHFDPATRALPLILCTADRRFLDAQAADLAATGLRSLAKPFKLDDLLAVVQQVLPDGNHVSS